MKRVVSLMMIILLTYVSMAPVTAGSVGMVSEFSCSDVMDKISIGECEALVALYTGTNGAGWLDDTNWLESNDPDDWLGVTVYSGYVSELQLDNNNLVGSLPPELANLGLLEVLSLRGNQLSGGIPPVYGTLTELHKLDLAFNQLSGSIPPALGELASLEVLVLSSNDLSGTIPAELSQISTLTGLYLGDNLLSGNIPSELGALSNLTALALYVNQLDGNIPPQLGNLSNLEGLNLSQNRLTGKIPPELGELSSLRLLILSGNHLIGDIPSTFLGLVNLADPGQYGGMDGLYLDDNILTIPPNYPDPAIPLHAFLSQKDPDWQLSQAHFLHTLLSLVLR